MSNRHLLTRDELLAKPFPEDEQQLMDAKPAKFSDESEFEKVAEIARLAIGEKCAAMVDAAHYGEGRHAVLLGSLAAVCECWVAEADHSFGADEIAKKLGLAITDFVQQAFCRMGDPNERC